MTKSESKYFNTALLMNQALFELLEKKDFDFITIKELCVKAGVNRSTFYLHYENMYDLLQECIENSNKKFETYFEGVSKDICNKINSCPLEELIFITPEYLSPYLNFIKENKTIHKLAVKYVDLMKSNEKFYFLKKVLLKPILKRFGIDEHCAQYMIAYYIKGTSAIVDEWIKNDCREDVSYIEKIIIKCIRPIFEAK